MINIELYWWDCDRKRERERERDEAVLMVACNGVKKKTEMQKNKTLFIES